MTIRNTIYPLLVGLILTLPAVLPANQDPAVQEAERKELEARRQEYEALIEEAELRKERARQEAREAREELELRRHRVEREREEVERRRNETQVREDEELKALREELGRTHRELQQTSRELARAHRELLMAESPIRELRLINTGDRAVIGILLGEQTDEGVKVIGVTPEGPAEKAGIRIGDVLTAIGDMPLNGEEPQDGRRAVFRIMDEVTDGEELAVSLLRDQQPMQLTVTAERREPASWQSMIRIVDGDSGIALDEGSPHVVSGLVLPEIDKEALAAEIAELEQEVQQIERAFMHSEEYRQLMDGDWTFEFEHFSDFGTRALEGADLWFGLPQAQGLELATMNPGLGGYFETERGVLVLRAAEDNAYLLQPGDVVLQIDGREVDTPSDMMRVLRSLEPDADVYLLIKRNRRDVTLQAKVPSRLLGQGAMDWPLHR